MQTPGSFGRARSFGAHLDGPRCSAAREPNPTDAVWKVAGVYHYVLESPLFPSAGRTGTENVFAQLRQALAAVLFPVPVAGETVTFAYASDVIRPREFAARSLPP
ncbi:hypothetical protein DTO013E5_4912 [Penicillium roqueforti]|nr:hypothetical protein DTO012A1_3451 [Penicillium roqueforti]KAI2755396.1 hypothetical protein DTO013F2_1079 [Penicillium roqueforti]KAI2770726.1 hypothetical protein DTO012A8_4469 [Penicillium roqueforti]KAI3077006.1 hypothetical protein CBS147339_4976 [Penicillium roqueforti]KAI3103555.1 hypothetical protein CBS147338_2084 [Penicillium roqueforti]